MQLDALLPKAFVDRLQGFEGAEIDLVDRGALQHDVLQLFASRSAQ
jgi:hypothetical protein